MHETEVWIDTGFNGDLVLPQQQIDRLALQQSGTVKAVLADGSEIALKRYTCRIDWIGERRDLEVVANDGEYPLLGVGLLAGHDLHVSYPGLFMARARFTISVCQTAGYQEVAQSAALFERIARRRQVNGDARWQRALRIIRAIAPATSRSSSGTGGQCAGHFSVAA
ncbi:MAG: hypothetical protein DWQ34_14265 [Planctomycetota bacterium]|nr:MAG: hypothetical protein DWQ34_14265 [Planctomycetota bacterium]